MDKRIVTVNGASIAAIHSNDPLITDGQTALDLIADVFYNDNCARILLNKAALTDRFFVLSSGIAGEVLQKIVNYAMKLAVCGDFNVYTSKPLRDFVYESNRGRSVYFAATEREGLDWLARL